ncbi:MAG: FtsX-like permease family protein [Candidatus Bathyarchaeia archaeon]
MRPSDVFRMAFKALKDRKLRSTLTILGIVIGSALIVALIASTRGLTANVQAQIEKTGVTTITVMPSSPRTPITDDDVNAIRSIGGIKDVIPYFSYRMSINYGSESIQVALYGLDLDKLSLLYKGLSIANGTLVEMYDPAGAVIGSAIANPPETSFPRVNVNEMLALQESSGKTFTFLVKGVLSSYGYVGFANLDETVFITSIAARLLFRSAYYSGIYVIANSPDDVNQVITSLEEYFGDTARIFSSSSLLENLQSITSQLTVFLGGIATVSLIVAGVGITNTMFVSVMERTREIGILKALGYRPRHIMSLFLAEAMLTGIIGSMLGTIAGIILSYQLGGALPLLGGPVRVGGPQARTASAGTSFLPVISPDLILFSLIFPVALSVLAGLYPAWRASRLNAVAALKFE